MVWPEPLYGAWAVKTVAPGNSITRICKRQRLAKFDFNNITTVQSSNDVDYIGEGEVLDILSTPVDGKHKT